MARPLRIVVLFMVLVLLSIGADSMGFTLSVNAADSMQFAAAPTLDGIASIWSTFWAFITFQVVGVPVVLSFVFLGLGLWMLFELIAWILNR